MKNIVIIGAGLGGLVAGANLSKNGHNVTVIEKHMVPGGYATNFSRKTKTGEKVTFDVSLHGIGDLSEGRVLNKLFENLGVLDKINFIRKKEMATVVLKNGEYIDIPDSFDEYKKILIEKFPKEKEGINKLFDFLLILSKETQDSGGKNIPKSIFETQDISLYDFLKKYVSDEKFIELFSFLWLYYGLPAKKINAYYYLVAWCTYHIGGTFYAKGGGGALSRAIAEIIKENGGNVVLNEEVVKLNTENGKIISVTTNKNKTFKADYFVINGCLEKVLKCSDNMGIIDKYLKDIENIQNGISLTQLYVGTDCNPTSLGIDKADLFYGGSGENTEESYEYAKNGDYENASYGVVNYNLLDEDLNKDTGYICVTIGDFEENWPEYGTEEYIEKKQKVINILLDKLYKNFPKLKDHVVITELGTPKTMIRYTGNKGGSVYGFAQNLENGGFNRKGHKTPFENGYIASAWTQPGGGYQGAILAGHTCSDIIIKDIQNVENRTYILDRKSINPRLFMNGMVVDADKNYMKNVNVVYKFSFTDIKKEYFVKIKDCKAKLLKQQEKPDTEIICDYKVWENIANNCLDGECAFKNGDIKIKGNVEKFNYISNIFKTPPINIEKDKKLVNRTYLVPLALLPFIAYWIFSQFYNGIGFLLLGTIYPIFVMPFFKPKWDRQSMGGIERLSILTFVLYYLLYINDKSFIFAELILPIGFIISCIFKYPILQDYSKYGFNKDVIKTKLFKIINTNITLIWALIFVVQFVIIRLIFPDTPLSNLMYIINIFGMIFSYTYPKSFEGKI